MSLRAPHYDVHYTCDCEFIMSAHHVKSWEHNENDYGSRDDKHYDKFITLSIMLIIMLVVMKIEAFIMICHNGEVHNGE